MLKSLNLEVPLSHGIALIFYCREIGRMDSSDLSRDTSGTRAYTAFLVEMTTNDPAAVLPNISLLLSHLDGEVKAPYIKVKMNTNFEH